MLSRISEQVGEGVVVADNDGWFQYVNPEFAVQHAGTVEELTGAHLSPLLHCGGARKNGPADHRRCAGARDWAR